MWLANDGNYREARWFTAWTKTRQIEDHYLPRMIRNITGQETVPFGDGVISTNDTVVGTELCEELFTPNSPHIPMSLDGVEIIINSSGSHWELRKLGKRLDLIRSASAKCGGVYLYSNLQGCDADRMYYDGSSLIAVNGNVVAQGTQFSLSDVVRICSNVLTDWKRGLSRLMMVSTPRLQEVITATIDIEDVRAARGFHYSRSMQAAASHAYPRIKADISLSETGAGLGLGPAPSKAIGVKIHSPEEEIR